MRINVNLLNDHLPPNNTPWGSADHKHAQAPGLVWVSTPGHGGIWMSPARLASFRQAFPNFCGYAGLPWLEEDCDWAMAALAFPDAFDDRMLRAAVDTVGNGRYLKDGKAFLDGHSAKADAIVERVAAYTMSINGRWERGGMGTVGSGHLWQVSFRQVGSNESRNVLMAYPDKVLYSTEELDALDAAQLNPPVQHHSIPADVRETVGIV